MWADNETSEDLLGFKVHADLLIDVINDDKVLPITIGVFGDWGSGKSSILKIITEQLSGKDDELKDNTLVLYFNGWVFEGYDDAKAALLESIIEKFEQHKTIGNKVKDKTSKLLKSVNWMRVLGLGFKNIALPIGTAYFTGGVSLAPFLLQQLSSLSPKDLSDKLGSQGEEFLKDIIKKQPQEDTSTTVREFRENFEALIKASEIKKLVVIIDDLDRCTPERIIENLEAIKLFLNVPKTAFIIGADPRIVRHAIEYRYKTDAIENSEDPNSRNKRIVSDYLEKLIQLPYNLPKLSDSEVETYMTLLFCKKELEEDFKNVYEAFCIHREKDRHSVFGFGNLQDIIKQEQKSKLGDSVSLIASLSSIITEGLNGNPRQIKRFLNTFTLRRKLVTVAKFSDFKIDILAKLMVLEYSNPDLFKKLYEWQATQQGEPKEIIELEELASKDDKEEIKEKKYSEWSNDKILKWLKVEPKLSKVDLRNYYWISRDQLTSTISGSSLIPEYIRSLYKKLIGHGSGKILTTTVTKEVNTINNQTDLDSLFSLLEKELLKNANNESIHKVFIELMQQNIINAVKTYTRIIKQIDNKAIPYNLHNELKTALKKNPQVQTAIDAFTSDSKIGKALKQN
ncbi:KAP family P-loop NTPase fold protein [Cytophaga aurantiaca]|uniref:KAP family P-loop NTPase fold protein n=1 Tax=Cytophaga aurantiaca TaxID=29530 RepID=UPI00036EBB1F|nr:P-loop NTPase fold protein [Cytophaga aurantiaca]